jgi:hypothetical protein
VGGGGERQAAGEHRTVDTRTDRNRGPWDGYYDIGGGKRLTLKDRVASLPLAMGHEIVGRVVKLGPEASGVQIGDRRLVFPWLGCGCFFLDANSVK